MVAPNVHLTPKHRSTGTEEGAQPVCARLCLSVPVCPCLFLSVPVCPCLFLKPMTTELMVPRRPSGSKGCVVRYSSYGGGEEQGGGGGGKEEEQIPSGVNVEQQRDKM
ncbi:hypothetical protein EYF80_059850 [Liparis tanakae]|uniref:Uncharacterized protein n=1 Tax=Liparis tanakae TaxID=230148 RepID=A0A4Z2EMJ7_9TELE|nr:hypothetical protein EYF80_059850 [Liparis tanakae]